LGTESKAKPDIQWGSAARRLWAQAAVQYALLVGVLLAIGVQLWLGALIALFLASIPLLSAFFFPGEEEEIAESALSRMRLALDHRTFELERERKELSTLMSAISEAILAVDVNEAPLFFNSRFLRLFGGAGFAARKPSLPEVFRTPEVLAVFRRALKQGEVGTIEISLNPEGQALRRDFSISVAPLRRDSGEGEQVYGAVGIFHDISELKRADRIRIDFVANVSHELRTPLTAIKGYADTLREDIGKGRVDSAAQFAEVIGRNSDRLMDLINDLLDLSSLESDDGKGGRKEQIPTRQLTERIFGQLAAQSLEKRQEVVLEPSSDAPSVYAEPGKIDQVLTNLLENAIKYVPAGGRITVRWERQPSAVHLHVVDNGPGIPPEHQARLFERFYRVEQARTRDAGGTGLGLAIVKHILQRHGGTVWVASEHGRGAEFVCRFPNE